MIQRIHDEMAAQSLVAAGLRACLSALAVVTLVVPTVNAQSAAPSAPQVKSTPAGPTTGAGVTSSVPAGYVIGVDDVLSIVYWRDKDMTTDVVVRPDGMISLPLLNDIMAAGLTPTALRDRLMAESKLFVKDPNVTVVVRQINSRKVFITGEVAKPGPYQVTSPITVIDLIAMAGGLTQYAHRKKIIILVNDRGKRTTRKFNYNDIGKNPSQNIELKPGDTVVVP
jgi:polysaccharide export outer membrane protein